jgi:DNA-binding transcriptional ArsR family regulator
VEVKLESSPVNVTLLEALKALADENRLKILALLSQSPHTGEQLAVLLDLGPSTVSHHLARLRHAGLVSAEAESYYSVYRLRADALAAVAHHLAMDETMAAMADNVYEAAQSRLSRTQATRGQPRTRRGHRPSRKS